MGSSSSQSKPRQSPTAQTRRSSSYLALGARTRRWSSYLALGARTRPRRRGKSSRIRRSSFRRYEIPRRFFARMFTHPETLQREVRLVPHGVAGTFVGLRQYGLRFGSRLRRLGLRNGDRVRQTGGTNGSSAAQVLEALRGLRNQNRLTVSIERGGLSTVFSHRVLD